MISVAVLIGSCGKQKDELSDSISNDILLLYHHNNPRLESLAKANCDADCQLLISFAMIMRRTSEDMMDQSGGVNENGHFIDPYREGEVVYKIIDQNSLYKSASDLVSKLNQSDSLPNNVTKIKEIIDFTFTKEEGIMTKNRVEQLPILFVCLDLLALENLVYTQLIEGV